MQYEDYNAILPENAVSGQNNTTARPGDNPNKANARRRKFNRPKTQNSTVSRETPGTLKWVDPTPVVVPSGIVAPLDPIPDSIPTGWISLRPDLPSTIARPFVDGLEALHRRTNLNADRAARAGRKLEAMTYYKASRQLFASSSSSDKTKLQPLKSVLYDDHTLPSHLAAGLSIIGNMDTKLGEVRVKYLPLVFKRWLAHGLFIDPDVSVHEPHLNAIWRDATSKHMLDDLCKEHLHSLCDETFIGTIGNREFQIRIPIPTFDDTGYASIPNEHPHAQEIRQLVATVQQTAVDYIAGAQLPHGQQIPLGILGLRLSEIKETTLRELFSDAMSSYDTEHRSHIEACFYMSPAPATNTGFPAQLVKSDDVTASFNYPLSDSDRVLGFIFNPLEKLELKPSYSAYSKRRKDDMLSEFAAKDFKPFAL
jgi:hypothetical protein